MSCASIPHAANTSPASWLAAPLAQSTTIFSADDFFAAPFPFPFQCFRSHRGGDPAAGFAGLFTQDHPRAFMGARQVMPQRPPDDARGGLIQRKASRHAADAIGAKQRALPSFHFCGDRQDAITTAGVTLILQETAVLFAAD